MIAALAGNIAIAIIKLVAALFSRSSSMISEAIHSFVESGDEVLLLVGARLSRRPSDEAHPFGHGREQYFWSFVVAIAIFGLGGGMSLYEGISRLVHPVEPRHFGWTLGVLASAAVFEAASFVVGYREFRKARPKGSLWSQIKASKDPATFTVVMEDSAALAGLAVAALGNVLSHWLHLPVLDGMGSVVIGLILCGVAALLSRESHGLLVGESAEQPLIQRIRGLIESDPAVAKVHRLLSMQLGVREVLLNVDVQFQVSSQEEVIAAVDRIERRLREALPSVRYVFIEAKGMTQTGRQHLPSSKADGQFALQQ